MKEHHDVWLRRQGTVFIHILVWCIVFAMPVIFAQREGFFRWDDLLRFLPLSTAFLVLFYINYFYLVDKLLIKRDTIKFIAVNVVIIIIIAWMLHLWHQIVFAINPPSMRIPPQLQDFPKKRPVFIFILRDISSLTFVAVLGTIIKMIQRLIQIQEQKKELEKAMVEAKLKNLKNQLNPHFLLNTLNNIYALSRINSSKVSNSIMELSELLRYMLYDNERAFVPLVDEAAFIRNYIDLMKLRLVENVKVTSNIEVSEKSQIQVAPLIFISLIENAFKHGINNDEPSFIEIELRERKNGQIYFLCRNSLFPKDTSDMSGSGIGLQQVQKRLELLYPYRYMWHREIENNVYSTVLIINTLKEDKNEFDT